MKIFRLRYFKRTFLGAVFLWSFFNFFDFFAEMIKRMFYPKKAIYKNGYKLVINGNTGGIDEFSYNGKEIEPKKDILDDLKNEREIFKGNEKFVI